MARVKWPGTGDSTRVQQGDKSREHRVSDEVFEQEWTVWLSLSAYSIGQTASSFTLHASTKNKETPCGSLRASVPTKVGTCFGPDSSSP